jgi:hypothetical protein
MKTPDAGEMSEKERAEYLEKRDAALAAGKIPMSEAAEMLTFGEIGTIEKHYGANFDDMSPFSTMAGTIWAMERRIPGHKFAWPDIDKMTVKTAQDYFAPEPIELDPDNPETDSGKDDTPDG